MQPTVGAGEHELAARIASTVCAQFIGEEGRQLDRAQPERGARRGYGGPWRPPAGGAVVFSCGMLHEVTPITRGRRYAFLPFLYDEAAARVREANNPHLHETVGAYQA